MTPVEALAVGRNRPRIIAPSAFADPETEKTREPFVHHRFVLNDDARARIRATPYRFGFDGFGEATYYRTYSRLMRDGRNESWPDTVLRVVDGVFSIRKDHYLKARLPWDEAFWQARALEMGIAIIKMQMLPPGRGLYAMGTDYVYERGAMALFNCAATAITDIVADMGWIMDALMCGVGVGFEATPDPIEMHMPTGDPVLYIIPDSREGWVESEELLLRSYVEGSNPIDFDYSLIRPEGAPLKGIGGFAAGPDPLRKLHERTRVACERYIRKEFGATRLKVDVGNAIGCCVVMGNVRRSAEITLGQLSDPEFLDLKNYDKNPERRDWGWMSNNSVCLRTHEDFETMPEIAARIRKNGEPGFINRVAISQFGRFGREMPDAATLMNPCGEIPLESKELCNLSEVFPARCESDEDLFRAMRLATLYSSTVALLPTHRPETNRVIARNRRIGVSVSGIAEWLDEIGMARMTRLLRDGYKVVRTENTRLAVEAGVPPSIRVTTIKPSGTISQLVGVPSGMHFPTFKYALRRMRVGRQLPIVECLKNAGYHFQPDPDEPERTLVFDFPIDQGKARKATDVSVWEQALLLTALQREWSDNSVSCTLYFNPKTEGDDLEHVLASIAPMVKSVSALPHYRKIEEENGLSADESPREGATKPYMLMPYEESSREEYGARLAAIKPIDWSKFRGDGEDEKYCGSDSCVVRPGGRK
jgi:ribonucleoside-triphosphate reductase (thioredoxin)